MHGARSKEQGAGAHVNLCIVTSLEPRLALRPPGLYRARVLSSRCTLSWLGLGSGSGSGLGLGLGLRNPNPNPNPDPDPDPNPNQERVQRELNTLALYNPGGRNANLGSNDVTMHKFTCAPAPCSLLLAPCTVRRPCPLLPNPAP